MEMLRVHDVGFTRACQVAPRGAFAVVLAGLTATVIAATGCSSGSGGNADGGTDAPTPTDAGRHDRSSPDVSLGEASEPDTTEIDTGRPEASETGPTPDGGTDAVRFDVVEPPDGMTRPLDVIVPPYDVIVPPPPLDATSTCGPSGGFGSAGPGSCSTGTEYSCGVDSYEVQCDCPSARCTCMKNGKALPTMVSYAGCPSCSATPFAFVATVCGIPY